MSCDVVTEVDNARVMEMYNVLGGFVSYTCESDHVFPAGGSARIVMCQQNGAWGETVEGCVRK